MRRMLGTRTMNALTALLRRAPRWGVLLPALLLVGASFLGGAHFHEGAPDHSCAVCTLSHATATTPVTAAPLAAPTTRVERVVLELAEVRALQVASDHQGRAPPLS